MCYGWDADAVTVPWKDAAGGAPAGSIPGLRALFGVDDTGTATYLDTNEGVYPPTGSTFPLADAMHSGWGEGCSNVVWSGTPSCTPGGDGCPSPQTSCLPLGM